MRSCHGERRARSVYFALAVRAQFPFISVHAETFQVVAEFVCRWWELREINSQSFCGILQSTCYLSPDHTGKVQGRDSSLVVPSSSWRVLAWVPSLLFSTRRFLRGRLQTTLRKNFEERACGPTRQHSTHFLGSCSWCFFCSETQPIQLRSSFLFRRPREVYRGKVTSCVFVDEWPCLSDAARWDELRSVD